MKLKVLNYYEKRIPNQLRNIIINKFNNKKISFKTVRYDQSVNIQTSLVKWADYLLLTPGRYIPDQVLDNAKHLKLIQIWSSGFDKLNLERILKNKIPLANNGSVNSISVSEHTILLILSLYRKLLNYSKRAKNGNWKGNSHGVDCYNLNKKKIGIIGLGKVGSKVAKICKSFGSKIFYYDIKKNKNLSYKYLPLKKLMSECDVISLHLHCNKNTFKILNKNLLSKMKKNSILINVSRAGLVDNEYLNIILKKKKIFGAGLDVFDKEPTQKGDLFLDLDNVVLTPHTAGSSLDTYLEVIDNCYNNIILASKNKKIKWLIKK